MCERPILLNADMVRAVLNGSKTQTRRIMKVQPSADFSPMNMELETDFTARWYTPGVVDKDGYLQPAKKQVFGVASEDEGYACPFGAVGDRLIPAMLIPSLDKKYCADVYGRIWSRARADGQWRRLHGSPNSKGYLTVTPAADGKYKTRFVHHLVAEAFYGPRPESTQVRHLDGNQFNNVPDNLDYGDGSENWSDRKALFRGMGESHHAAKLTRDAACAIRNSLSTQRSLAAQYGVSQSIISDIKNGRTWQDAAEAKAPNMPRWASRITLDITGVRVERLNSISEEDAKAEGAPTECCVIGDKHFLGFRSLWRSIYGAESWQANPWVWVIEFKRVET